MKICIGLIEYDIEELINQLNMDLLVINAEIGGLKLLQERKQQTLVLLRNLRKSPPK